MSVRDYIKARVLPSQASFDALLAEFVLLFDALDDELSDMDLFVSLPAVVELFLPSPPLPLRRASAARAWRRPRCSTSAWLASSSLLLIFLRSRVGVNADVDFCAPLSLVDLSSL